MPNEIRAGSQWKHRHLSDVGPDMAANSPPNLFTVTGVNGDEIQVVQATYSSSDPELEPTFWDRETFPQTFEEIGPALAHAG